MEEFSPVFTCRILLFFSWLLRFSKNPFLHSSFFRPVAPAFSRRPGRSSETVDGIERKRAHRDFLFEYPFFFFSLVTTPLVALGGKATPVGGRARSPIGGKSRRMTAILRRRIGRVVTPRIPSRRRKRVFGGSSRLEARRADVPLSFVVKGIRPFLETSSGSRRVSVERSSRGIAQRRVSVKRASNVLRRRVVVPWTDVESSITACFGVPKKRASLLGVSVGAALAALA